MLLYFAVILFNGVRMALGKPHPEEVRARARELWLSGRFSSDDAIAKEIGGGINESTIGVWRRDEDWGADRLKMRDAELEAMVQKRIQALETWTEPMEQIGRALIAGVAHHLKQRKDANGNQIYQSPQDLKRLADTWEKVQLTIWRMHGLGEQDAELNASVAIEYKGLDVMATEVLAQIRDMQEEEAAETGSPEIDE